MSYDIWMKVDPGPGIFETPLDLGNMTSNVAKMWRKASPETDGLAGIDGKTGAEVALRLTLGLDNMFRQRRLLEKDNPSNGWGSYPDAFRYFARITRAARNHPNATFGVSR